ncbi:MAG TPA: hypothetical protein VK306_13910 [Acidimicrobiales bacterium]|nr:hypothetical protein [Acidimicrobiales bacterium]
MSAINVTIEITAGRGRRRDRQVEVLLEWPPLPTWAVALDDARDLHRDLGRVLEAVPRLAPSVERWSATPGRMPPTATFEPWLVGRPEPAGVASPGPDDPAGAESTGAPSAGPSSADPAIGDVTGQGGPGAAVLGGSSSTESAPGVARPTSPPGSSSGVSTASGPGPGAGEHATGGVLDVAGAYSRAVWLPVIGPTAWLVWGTVVAMLTDGEPKVLASDELAHLHGVGAPALVRALSRLRAFGLAGGSSDDRWSLRLTCPPLWDRLAGRIPATARALHDEMFPSSP